MSPRSHLRIATYNIHKCRGLDGRTRPERIAAVLREIDADVIALQEVLGPREGEPGADQIRNLCRHLPGFGYVFGENRKHGEAAYGNAVLSRLPIENSRNYDLTWRGCERRGCLRADVVLPGGEVLHVFNVHLGTAFLERRHQGRVLTASVVRSELRGPRIVLGDFNEWTRGLATRLLAADLERLDVRRFLLRRRTYPGVLPVLELDSVYYDRSLELEHFFLHKNRRTLVASDHLPMVAEFHLLEPAVDHQRASLGYR
jgi:endonuclease/exonuclease/phosphatase family metal-dependent hydrolase